MKLVDIWDIEQNFWLLNPQLKLVFKSVYESDKSKNKENSSKWMWSVALFTDIKSKFKDLNETEREIIIQKDYNKSFNVVSAKSEIDKWKTFLSPAERHLMELEKKFEQRTEYLRNVEYSADTIDDLDKQIANTEKLLNALAKFKTMVAEEESEGIVKGGAVESLTEKGEI